MCRDPRGPERILILKGLDAIFSHVPMDHCQSLSELREDEAAERYCLRRPSMERYSGVGEIQRHAVKTRKVKYIALITLYSHFLTLIDESFLKQNWHFTLHSTIPLTLVTAAVTALHQRSTLVLYKRVKSYQRETG